MSELTLVMLKPDCLERKLEKKIIDTLLEKTKGEIVASRYVIVDVDQIYQHCEGLIQKLGESVKPKLAQMYEGKMIKVLLIRGEDIIRKTRMLIGNADPSKASPETIRGQFCNDSFDQAMKENRLVNNLIHASDSQEDVLREKNIWFNTG